MENRMSYVALSARRTGARSASVAVAGPMQTQMFRRMVQAAALGALVTLGATLLGPTPAHALSMQECSAKYKAAQAAGTLGSAKWNDFRKSQCEEGAAATGAPSAVRAPAAAPTSVPPAGAVRQGGAPVTGQTAPVSRTAPQVAPGQQPAMVGSAVFPRAVAAKYAADKPSKQRMGTCLDQYNANKLTNGNGGLKWIQKGGGYYSECNKRLKN